MNERNLQRSLDLSGAGVNYNTNNSHRLPNLIYIRINGKPVISYTDRAQALEQFEHVKSRFPDVDIDMSDA